MRETPRVVTLQLASDAWPGHLPGAPGDVRRTPPQGYHAPRADTSAASPAAGRLALTIEDLPDGEVSPYLTEEVRPGDRFELRGPIGGYFTWTEATGGPLLLVAGGSGVVPLMSILRYRAAVGSEVPTVLLYSSRSWEEIIYRAELDRLSQDPRVRVLHTLTRSHPEGWTGYTRRIDRAMLAEAAAIAPGGRAYVCGPTVLVENVASELVALGYSPERVKTERFGPSGG